MCNWCAACRVMFLHAYDACVPRSKNVFFSCEAFLKRPTVVNTRVHVCTCTNSPNIYTHQLVIPSASRSTLGGASARAAVSDADMQIASALASSVTTVKTSCVESKVHIDDEHEEVAHQPKFILDEGHADHPFHSELMDSEFFAELPKHGAANADEVWNVFVCVLEPSVSMCACVPSLRCACVPGS
jgi:hypothetical protein